MARIRTIKPEFWGDEKLAPMDALTRLVFLGLISAMADDAGRLLDSVKMIDGVLFALTDDSARESLAKLAESGRIKRGMTASGQRIIQIVNWHHQKVDHPNLRAALPPIVQELTPDGAASREPIANDSRELRDSTSTSTSYQLPTTSVATGAREADGVVASPQDELASLIGQLPRSAIGVLEMCYEPALTTASRMRYVNVAMQLLDTITPGHPGPKIRGGMRVKARSVEHLEDVCASVLRDPPMNRDAAIVFVLQKLTDPPKGPSVTEQAKAAESQSREREDAYQRAAKVAGVAWAKEHPDEYEPIRTQVEKRYEGKTGDWIAPAREAELVQLCAKKSGFPPFEIWQQSQAVSA